MSDTLQEVHPWLRPFSPPQRALVAAWFFYGVTQGASTPDALVRLVGRVVAGKLAGSVSPPVIALCDVTLAALVHRRGEALQYAQTLLAAPAAGADEPS